MVSRAAANNRDCWCDDTIDDLSTATLVGMRMKGSLVTETWMLRWRDAHLDGGAADTRLEWVDDLVSTYLTAWAAENESAMERLYSEDAVVDLGAVEPLVGRGEIVSSDAASLSNAELAVVSTADRTGPALFVFPAADTQEIAFAVTARSGTCDGTHAILLGLDEKRRIATEERAPSLATLRECDADRLAGDGWWSDLAIPPPLEEQTDTFVGPAGDQIPIVNGTPEMERFLSWGLGRFALAGLVPLRLGSVMFAPVRACAERSGLVIEDFDADHHLVICTDPYRACEPDADACTGFTALSRFGLLHELAHVWHLNNLGAETEAVFVEFSGTESWHSVEDPWQERGAEHAAEMTAWGLMDEPVALVRLGEPACDRLARGFRILTGADPLRTCDG